MRRTGGALAAALTLCVVPGCGASEVAEPAPTVALSAAVPKPSEEAIEVGPSQAAPMTVPCAPADGTTSDFQLTEATLLDTGAAFRLTWTTNQDPPGTVGYRANVWNDGLEYELGVEFRDGELYYFGVFNLETGEISELPGDDLQESWPSRSFTATFPNSTMPGVEGAVEWTAGLSLEVGGGEQGVVSDCRVEGAPVAYP